MITLIKHGTVIDGTGAPPAKLDILIRGGRIVRLGTFPKLQTDAVIDAAGSLVTPGFVDAGTRSDAMGDLGSDDSRAALAMQGITTIIGGHCGWSQAPWESPDNAREGEWHHPIETKAVWRSLRDLFRSVARSPLGANFGTLVGFGALARAAGGNRRRGGRTERDEATLLRLLGDALAGGALGLSLQFGGVGAATASARDVKRFAGVLAEAGSVLAVHAGNSFSKLPGDVRTLLGIAGGAKVALRFSHLEPRMDRVGASASGASAFMEAVAEIERAAGTCDACFDMHPFETVRVSLLFEARELALLEARARRSGSAGSALAAAPAFRALAAHLPLGVIVERVFDKSLRFLEGKSVDELAVTRARTPEMQLLDVVRLTRGRATFLVRDVSGEALSAGLLSPRALIATHGYGDHIPAHPMLYVWGSGHSDPPAVQPGAHVTFLRWACPEGYALGRAPGRSALPIEQAVHKITGFAARAYHLRHRGTIAEGFAADVAVLDASTFAPTDVLVNGVRTLALGVPTLARAGSALARKRP